MADSVTTNEVAHVLACMGYHDWSAQVLEGHAAEARWELPEDDEPSRPPTEFYAVMEHEREDLPWPAPADAWYWQVGDRWVAVYEDFVRNDWWEGSSPEDIAQRPRDWRRDIEDIPTYGKLVYRRADGGEVETDAPNWMPPKPQLTLGAADIELRAQRQRDAEISELESWAAKTILDVREFDQTHGKEEELPYDLLTQWVRTRRDLRRLAPDNEWLVLMDDALMDSE